MWYVALPLSLIMFRVTIACLTVTQSTQAVDVSDHHLQLLNFDIPVLRVPPRFLWVRSFRKCQWDQLRDSLCSAPWDIMTMLDDIDDKWEFFHHILMLSLNEFAPLHRVNCKNSRRSTPWFSDSIAQMIKEKYKARHLTQRTGSDDDWSAYRRLKNQLKATVVRQKWITFSVLLGRVSDAQRRLHICGYV